MIAPLVLACVIGTLLLGCSEAPGPPPPPAVGLPSCASPDPGAEATVLIDAAGRVHLRRGLWKEAHEMGGAGWLRDLETLLRRTDGPVILAVDAQQPIEALTLFLVAGHHAQVEIRLLTEHEGERHAIPISTTVPPRSTSALEVRWSSGDFTLEHGPLRLPERVATVRVPDDGVSAILDELSVRQAEVLLIHVLHAARQDPLEPLLRLLCAGRARVDRVVVIPEVLEDEAVFEQDRLLREWRQRRGRRR
ncbi:MAG: hypothetical protein SangKO_005130 [Sandaracinaceae bacterium]